MAFRYDPNAPQGEIIPAGSYMATILAAEEKVSKTGNPMIELKFKLYMDDGTERTMKDWIVQTMAWKLGKVADAIGKTDAFASGEFNRKDYIGCNLEVKIEHKPDKRDGGVRAQITGFAPLAGTINTRVQPISASKDATVKDDDIPF
jgi:hypothetical protein